MINTSRASIRLTFGLPPSACKRRVARTRPAAGYCGEGRDTLEYETLETTPLWEGPTC